MLEKGLTYTSSITVTNDHTAICMGSGDMNVFATPAMVALMENAAMKCVAPHIPSSDTTVGSHIETSHIKPSALNASIETTATLTEINDRKLIFHVIAKDGETIIGEGTHIRYIVNREKFLSKL